MHLLQRCGNRAHPQSGIQRPSAKAFSRSGKHGFRSPRKLFWCHRNLMLQRGPEVVVAVPRTSWHQLHDVLEQLLHEGVLNDGSQGCCELSKSQAMQNSSADVGFCLLASGLCLPNRFCHAPHHTPKQLWLFRNYTADTNQQLFSQQRQTFRPTSDKMGSN